MLSNINKQQQYPSSDLQKETRLLHDLIELQSLKKSQLITIEDYLGVYCSNKQKITRQYSLKHDGYCYSFQKLLPFTVEGERYMGLSQAALLLSPFFLKGIEKNLRNNLKYQQQRLNFLLHIQKTAQKANENHRHTKLKVHSQEEEQFILNFLKKHKDLPETIRLFRALMRPNYFCHSQISQDQLLRSQLQNRELYFTNPSPAIKDRLIQKVFGKNSLWGRYSQFSVSSHPILTYCIRKKGSTQFIACLYLQKVPKSDYFQKIRNPIIVEDLISHGFEQFLYIYYINILEEHQGEGHGRRIIEILKSTGLPIVLCSRATQKSCGWKGIVTTGQFYVKCGFTEYYPTPTLLRSQLDIGCLNLSKEHDKCIPEKCQWPMQRYPAQSYFVYYKKQK